MPEGQRSHGVEIHTQTEVTGLKIKNNRVTGVHTSRGDIQCGKVLQAVSGMSSEVARMAGFKLPIKTIPLQACVTEPVKPFLDPIIVSGSLHVYVSQSSRGELVMGASADPYPLYFDPFHTGIQGRADDAHAGIISLCRQVTRSQTVGRHG